MIWQEDGSVDTRSAKIFHMSFKFNEQLFNSCCRYFDGNLDNFKQQYHGEFQFNWRNECNNDIDGIEWKYTCDINVSIFSSEPKILLSHHR